MPQSGERGKDVPMATLKNAVSAEYCRLRAHHVFGRDSIRCDTVMPDPCVSRVHAHIRWHRGGWELHDYSSNGTLVSGNLLRHGEVAKLAQGDLICFGKSHGVWWQVAELGDPTDLPAVGDPTLLVVAHDDFFVPPQRMDFAVSLDEEHVRARLQTRGGTVDLGERSHHYCLVTLARVRYADANRGYDAASQGWVDVETLARMLGIDVPHVNVQIHRARAQFAALPGLADVELIERRRGSVRFGGVFFRVFRGDALECQSLSAVHAASSGDAWGIDPHRRPN
jgi:hypothetical protein